MSPKNSNLKLSRLARFTAISAVVYAVGLLISYASPTSIFTILEGIGFVGLAACLAVYLYRALGWVKRKMLWKVRNKIIISYAFVGIIPVLILATLAWFSFTLIFRQFSVLYLENEIREIQETLGQERQQILLDFYRDPDRSERSLETLLSNDAPSRATGLKDILISLIRRVPGPGGAGFQVRATYPRGREPAANPLVPAWFQDDFDGLVNQGGKLYFRSLCNIELPSGSHFLLIELPLDERLLQELEARTKIQIHLVESESELQSAFSELGSGQSGSLEIRWAHVLSAVDWNNRQSELNQLIALSVPLRTLWNHFFTSTGGFGGALLYILVFLGAVFILVEIISLLIGVAIARSITGSIHNIYAGTRHLQEADFQFRIPSSGRDQLDEVAAAFNQMADSVVRLMSEVTEKERLEKEIEIAREVQNQLYPQSTPAVSRLQLAAVCLPARRVSGDYYDFIPFGEDQIDVVIGDISGKGISAALLMASLQSLIRSQVLRTSNRSGRGHSSGVVAEINRQLYNQTAADKFATLVFSHFDSSRLTLTYCNAGHNPPLLLSEGEVRKLTQGGIVAGLFEDRPYEEENVQLQAGDLILFYTDGIVEAENPSGEQFGEDRLNDLIRTNGFLTPDDLRELIVQQVTSWTAGGEQRDDMTLVIMKVES